MTPIYLLRHSQSFRKLLGEYNVNEVEQLRNGVSIDIQTRKFDIIKSIDGNIEYYFENNGKIWEVSNEIVLLKK